MGMTALLEEFFKQNTIIENDEIKALLNKYLTGQIDEQHFRSSFLVICEAVAEVEENIVLFRLKGLENCLEYISMKLPR
jgi:hypothetical protein